MNKARVLLTVPHLDSTASPYREMMNIARYLPHDEFDLTICSLRLNGIETTGPVLDALGVRYFIAPFRPKGRRLRHVLASLRAQRTITQMGPFDIWHSFDFSSSPFEALMSRRSSKHFIHHQRNLGQHGSGLLRQLRLSGAKRVIAISSSVKEYLLGMGVPLEKIVVILNGLDLDEIEGKHLDQLRIEPPVVLSVGHIRPLKRQADAIRMIAALSCTTAAQLWIVGATFDAGYLDELKDLTRELDVEDRVRFLGVRDDVLDLMSQSSVLLHCSESEAFGWVLVEAMAAGLPVIAADTTGPREIIGENDCGLLVRTGDIAGYAANLSRVLSDRALAQSLRIKGRSIVERKYSARVMVEQIAALYRSIG